MIDFNTVMNTLFQAAVEAQTKPLLDKIDEQDKRILEVVDSALDRFVDTVDDKVKEAIDEIAINVLESKISDEVQEQIEKLDAEDIVRDILKNATVEISV